MLNDEGWLEVAYLGTELPKSTIPNLETRDQTYDELNSRLSEMNARLESTDQDNKGNSFKETKDTLNIKCKVLPIDNQPEFIEDENGYLKNEDGDYIGAKLRVTLSFTGTETTKVSVNINVPKGFYTEQSLITFDKIESRGTPSVFETNV